MAEERFPIVVELKPDVANGERAIGQSLDGIEKRAEDASERMSAAISGFAKDVGASVRDAMLEVDRLRAAEEKAARAAEAAAAAAANAAQKEQRAADALRDAFGKLERSTLATVRAEHEYLAAEKLVTEAVKAGITTEERARAILEEKAKALEHVTVAQQANTAEGDKSKTSLLQVVDVVGKVGAAMETVNKGMMLGRMAWGAFGSAVDAVDKALGGARATAEEWQKFIDDGGLRGFGEGFQDLFRAAANKSQWWEDAQFEQSGGWEGNGLSAVDRMFDAAIDALTENADRYRTAAEKAAADMKASQKRLLDQSDAIRTHGLIYQAGGHTQTLEEYMAEKRDQKRLSGGGGGDGYTPDKLATASGMWNFQLSKIEQITQAVDALARAQSNLVFTAEAIGDTADSDAIILGAATGRSMRRTDAGFAVGKSGSAYGVSTDKDIAAKELREATTEAQKFADAMSGPVSSAVDGLIDGLVHWKMSWKEWGQEALAQMAKVAAQMLILAAIKSAFDGNVSGGAGGFLWKLFGGGSGGSSARYATGPRYGDPFGGGGTSGAVWRDPVMPAAVAREAGGQRGGDTHVIVVANMQEAALAAARTAEFGRVIVTTVHQNRDKLGIK